jgi:acetyltransferase-like isoleucine patch superfamily enzyme
LANLNISISTTTNIFHTLKTELTHKVWRDESHPIPIKITAIKGVTRQGIVIEDDCWLGHGVTVLDGVTIGKGSVIGAGSVVNKDIPPYSVAVGAPVRVIKSRIKDLVTSSTN